MQLDAKIRAIERLLQRDDLSQEKEQQLRQVLAELRDARILLRKESLLQQDVQRPANDRRIAPDTAREPSPGTDWEAQLTARMKAERARHENSMRELERALDRARAQREQERELQEKLAEKMEQAKRAAEQEANALQAKIRQQAKAAKQHPRPSPGNRLRSSNCERKSRPCVGN